MTIPPASPLDAYDRRIDREHQRWLAALPPPLRSAAAALPHTIGLSRRRRWRSWRDVFRSPVMRSLPGLIAEGFPRLSRRVQVDLGVAHILTAFVTFFDDRLNDAQAALTRDASLIRRAMEAEAQQRLTETVGSHAPFWGHQRRAFRRYERVHAEEPGLWADGVGYSHAMYARDSAAKLANCQLAAVAAARRGGAAAAQVARLSRVADHCVVALQYIDDVEDWDEDFVSGRWTYFVQRHLTAPEIRRRRPITRAELRARVAGSAVSEEFLWHASRHLTAAGAILDDFAMPLFRHWIERTRTNLRARVTARRLRRDHARQRFARALERCWAA